MTHSLLRPLFPAPEEYSRIPARNQPAGRDQHSHSRSGRLRGNGKGALTLEKLQLLSAKHGIKVRLARELRREMTMEIKWTAKALGLASWKRLSNLLNREEFPSGEGELGV